GVWTQGEVMRVASILSRIRERTSFGFGQRAAHIQCRACCTAVLVSLGERESRTPATFQRWVRRLWLSKKPAPLYCAALQNRYRYSSSAALKRINAYIP